MIEVVGHLRVGAFNFGCGQNRFIFAVNRIGPGCFLAGVVVRFRLALLDWSLSGFCGNWSVVVDDGGLKSMLWQMCMIGKIHMSVSFFFGIGFTAS